MFAAVKCHHTLPALLFFACASFLLGYCPYISPHPIDDKTQVINLYAAWQAWDEGSFQVGFADDLGLDLTTDLLTEIPPSVKNEFPILALHATIYLLYTYLLAPWSGLKRNQTPAIEDLAPSSTSRLTTLLKQLICASFASTHCLGLVRTAMDGLGVSTRLPISEHDHTYLQHLRSTDESATNV